MGGYDPQSVHQLVGFILLDQLNCSGPTGGWLSVSLSLRVHLQAQHLCLSAYAAWAQQPLCTPKLLWEFHSPCAAT